MKLVQQSANCSDFDVVLGNETTASFRVLLPEWIRADGLEYKGHFHTIPGTWAEHKNGVEGLFSVGNELDIGIHIETGLCDMHVTFTVTNIGRHDLTDVTAEICTSLNHLPGNPGWCNIRFFPDTTLDRAVQGRYWFEQLTPHRLFALTREGWVAVHPCPDQPDTYEGPLYNFKPGQEADAKAYAVQSPDGQVYFFQAWDAPCRYCLPCPGNACMHLQPLITSVLKQSESATIHGLIGIHSGDQERLAQKIEVWSESIGKKQAGIGRRPWQRRIIPNGK